MLLLYWLLQRSQDTALIVCLRWLFLVLVLLDNHAVSHIHNVIFSQFLSFGLLLNLNLAHFLTQVWRHIASQLLLDLRSE